jgi:hypothetical protein
VIDAYCTSLVRVTSLLYIPPSHRYNLPMATRENEEGPRSVTKLLLPLIALSTLAGCASSNLYWGPALSTCSGSGSAANFAKGACRNGAEYDAERKKAKRSLSDTALGYDEGPRGRFSK